VIGSVVNDHRDHRSENPKFEYRNPKQIRIWKH